MSEIENKELTPEKESGLNFVEQMVADDLKNGKNGGRLNTRFPPEPNGYLHIGHAKSILLNYGLAQKYNGKFNLRFDDTNPTKEKSEFVESIKADVKWLGADWEDRLFFASDYFDQMYEFAVELIKKGLAYVCELTPDKVREYRGDTQTPAKSPYRDRPIEESLDLFERMKNCIGCTYISDLPRYRYEVWEKMKRISLDQYTLKQLDDFCEYVFGIRYWMVKQMQEREGTFEKSECK